MTSFFGHYRKFCVSTTILDSALKADKLIALGYEFHYHTRDGADLFRKKVIGLD